MLAGRIAAYPTALSSRSAQPAAPLTALRISRLGVERDHSPADPPPLPKLAAYPTMDRPDIDSACTSLFAKLATTRRIKCHVCTGPYNQRRFQPLHALVLRPTGMDVTDAQIFRTGSHQAQPLLESSIVGSVDGAMWCCTGDGSFEHLDRPVELPGEIVLTGECPPLTGTETPQCNADV